MAQTAGRPAPWALAFFAGLLVSGCATWGARRTPLAVSERDPSVSGVVATRELRGGGTRVAVRARGLSPIERLDPPADAYVVWIRPDGADRAQNLGALKIDRGLRGRLDAVVPWKSFELFVTPEDRVDAPQPGGDRLMWANVFDTVGVRP